MKVLFVLPSVHTNLAFAIPTLTAAGVEVHAAVTFTREGTPAEATLHLTRPPLSFAAARALVREVDPDLVVIRKVAGLSRPVAFAALSLGRPLLGYDQRPALRPRPPLDARFGILRGRPRVRITPVLGLRGGGARPDPNAIHAPFPVIAAPEPPRPPQEEGPLRILCVGKLAEARKDHFALIEALERLADRPFTLTIAGSSSTAIGTPDAANRDRLLAYPETGALGSRVTIRPDVAFADMPALYRAHDLCVLPSRREPLGTAPLEAMAHGAAAIISDECGTADVIAEAERAGLTVGALFRAGDRDALTATLARFVDDPSGTRAIGEAARRWTEEFLSPERFVAAFRTAAARVGVPPERLPG